MTDRQADGTQVISLMTQIGWHSSSLIIQVERIDLVSVHSNLETLLS